MTMGLWALSAVLFYLEAQAEGRKLFDRSLSESGALLLRLAEHEIDEHGPSMAAELLRAETHASPSELRFQIWTEDLRARAAARLPVGPAFMPLDATGFGWAEVNGALWRVYAGWNPRHTLQVQIAEPLTRRKELSSWTYVHLTLLAGLLLPISLLLIWWILTRSIEPLRRSATAVGQRSPDDLRPVGTADAPEEVTPLLVALNRLLGRVREALHRERRFTADAAHELRSPLAAVRANAQVLCASRDDKEREEVTANLLASVDRGSRLIDQLLMLARVDSRDPAQLPNSAVVLDELVRTECAADEANAAQKGIRLFRNTEPVVVSGDEGLLTVLVRNLMDNAIRYSPNGSSVQISCRTHEGAAELIVSDNGRGIAPEDRERVFERFYRVVGNDSTGSGLGLSIVRSISGLHGGSVRAQAGPGGSGTAIIVRLPLRRSGGSVAP
jgi:signal transduction histidine kinase